MGYSRKLQMLFAAGFLTAAIANPALGQTREEINRQPTSPLPSSVGQPVSVNDGIERAPCPLAATDFANVTLTLTSVEFGDPQGIPVDILRTAYAGYIGKVIPVATLCDIRDRAAMILRSRGYLAAVQLPPQRIDNGKVRFELLVAKIVDFQVRGNAGKAERLIASYLSAIKAQPVFNILEAERYLLLARDIPGYDVRLTLRPAGAGRSGEVIGEVIVEYAPVEAQANVQNYGSRETGRFGGLAEVSYNGLFGAGDRTTIGYFATADFKEQHVIQASEQVRLGREGLTLNGDFVYAWTRPSIDPSLDLRTRTWVATVEARYPLVRRQSRNLSVAGGFEAIDQLTRIADTAFTADKLRVVYARLDFDSFDPQSIGSVAGYSDAEPKWRFGGSFEVRQGIGVLGNSQDCGPALARCSAAGVIPISRVDADTTALVTRARLISEYRPHPLFAIATALRLQYAPRALLGYEEFSAGNFTTGRGYDPGVISGETGYGVSLEGRYGSLVPASNKAFAWQIYGFTDAARVSNRDVQLPSGNTNRLVSAGYGVRMAYGNRLNLDLGATFPLRKAGTQSERTDPRLLLNLTVKLLPWQRR